MSESKKGKYLGKNNPMYGKIHPTKGTKWFVNSKNETLRCFPDDDRLQGDKYINGRTWLKN